SALRSLAELDPKTAIPALRQVVQTEEDARVRKQCVEVLGRKFTREAVGVLEDVAKSDRDEDVRGEAEYWLGKIRTRLIPTQLNYYCFEARLTDPSEYAKVPEGKVAAFSVAHGRPGSASRAKSGISRIFNGRISFWGSWATNKGATDPYEFLKDQATTTLTSHKIHNFHLALEGGSVKKTAETIEGRVRFDDLVSAFKVNDQNDALLAARRGDRLAVMYLEMAPKDVEALGAADDEESMTGLLSVFASVARMFQKEPKEPVYYTSTNTMGIVINSTLQSDVESFKKGIHDYSLSEAKIPGAGGTWTLTGHLLLNSKEGVLVGRMAKLIRPDGSTAAAGDEIRVPVKDPAAFTTAGGRVEAGQEKPSEPEAVSDANYTVSFNLENGGWIYTTRPSFSIEEFGREAVDCGTAKALISGRGGTWILTGRLVLMNKARIIVARDARLMDPEGKIVAQGALMTVPIKQPEKYTLARARGN
ncbi:MAG: HEAT repeat domain-containing protein, partial [Candidatus Aminicenantes bacterium]|nr:HEAT repeat domain-containing protein [Candidatus Aminicenantes bacterium]